MHSDLLQFLQILRADRITWVTSTSPDFGWATGRAVKGTGPG
jgi:hypothetical protein